MLLFYILVFSLPLNQHHLLGATIGSWTVSKLIGLICLVPALWNGATKGTLGKPFGWTGGICCLVYFGVAMASSVAVGGVSLESVITQNNVLSILVLLFVTVLMINSARRLYVVLLVTIGSTALASIYTIREWVGNRSLANYRPGSISGDANYFAACAAASLLLAFALLLSCRRRWEQIYLLGSLLVTLIAFTLAASRGGAIGLLAGLLLLLVQSRRPLRNFMIASSLITPLLVVMPNSPLQRLVHPDSGAQLAVDAREVAWRAGMRIIAEHPITGVGVGRFKDVVVHYEKLGVGLEVQSVAHNTYIEVAAEQGIVGFVPFIATLIATFIGLWRAVRMTAQTGPEWLHHACIGLESGLVALGVAIFFISAWWFRFFWFAVFLMMCTRTIALGFAREKKTRSLLERQHDQRKAHSSCYARV